MCASEYERLDIVIHLLLCLYEERVDLVAEVISVFDRSDELWNACLRYLEVSAQYTDTILIGFDVEGVLRRQEAYFAVHGFSDSLGCWERDSQDFSIWKGLTLQVANSMCGEGIRCEDDDRRPIVKEPLSSLTSIFSYGLFTFRAVGTACLIRQIDNVDIPQDIQK